MSELLELFCAPVVLEELDREDVLDSEVLELDGLDELELLAVLEELELAVLLELEDELDWSHGGAGGVWPFVLPSITRIVAPSLCPRAYHACSSRFPSISLMHMKLAPRPDAVTNLSSMKPMSFPSPERTSIG